MYADLTACRANIEAYALQRYSWELVADITIRAYKEIQAVTRHLEEIW